MILRYLQLNQYLQNQDYFKKQTALQTLSQDIIHKCDKPQCANRGPFKTLNALNTHYTKIHKEKYNSNSNIGQGIQVIHRLHCKRCRRPLVIYHLHHNIIIILIISLVKKIINQVTPTIHLVNLHVLKES